jgi:TPR repeat protein
MTTKVALYCRVSTSTKDQTTENQLRELQSYCDRMEYEVVKWYRLAAEQGYADAQFNLGVMYANGEGVIQNNVSAHMLFNLAGAQGDEEGRKNRDLISKQLTTSDISKAQEMARVCVENNYKGCGF